MLFLACLIAFLSILIGLIVILGKPFESAARYLFGFSILSSLWTLSNYFSNDVDLSYSTLVFMNQLVIFFGLTGAIAVNIFVEQLIPKRASLLRRRVIYALGILVSVLTLTPLVVRGVDPSFYPVKIEFAELGIVFFVTIVYFLLRILWLSIAGYRNSRSLQRSRILVVTIGIFGAAGVLVVTNVAAPFLFGSYDQSALAPIVLLATTGTLAYAIFLQKLFSVTAGIMRAFAYVLSLGIIVLVYAFLANVALDELISSTELGLSQKSFFIVCLIIAVVVFQPIKNIIDRYLQKIFYRDAYDSREILDKLSDIFVADLLSESLLVKNSINIIHGAVKSSYILFAINRLEYLGVGEYAKLADKDIERLFRSISKKVIGTYLRNDLHQKKIDVDLRRLNIEIVVRIDLIDGQYGYLFFGPKKNGSSYSKQDIELLSTIRKNLSLAVQNARNYKEVSNFAQILEQEVEAATNTLRKTNSKLRETSTAKDEFISMAAHQIRPQLTAVRGFVDLLAQSKIDTSQSEILNWTSTGVERMIRIITDMLNLSRITSGEFKINLARVDPNELVKNEILAINPMLKTSGITIHQTYTDESFTAHVDDIKVREVIANLLSNAIQYNGDKTQIDIAIEIVDGGWECSVRDYGIGVKKEDETKLFKKYIELTMLFLFVRRGLALVYFWLARS